MKTRKQKDDHAAYMRNYYLTNDRAYLKLCLRRVVVRCTNPKDKEYHLYGGRDITVCRSWVKNPESFVEWAISVGWKRGLEIDRKNNERGYSPANCRWVTDKVNSRNRSNNKLDEIKIAKILSLLSEGVNGVKLAEMFGVHHSLIYRIKLKKQWVG